MKRHKASEVGGWVRLTVGDIVEDGEARFTHLSAADARTLAAELSTAATLADMANDRERHPRSVMEVRGEADADAVDREFAADYGLPNSEDYGEGDLRDHEGYAAFSGDLPNSQDY